MLTTPTAQDHQWMLLALEQARLGLGLTSPNPPVGAVIVQTCADGSQKLLAADYHPRAGELHAERRAIMQAREKGQEEALKGACIYVTLEPCSSWGKTPPCTDAIIESGIARVVYACVDPDLRHRGCADALLRAAGIVVLSGVCEAACGALLRPWAYAVTHKRPWIVAKVATSLDARLSRQSTPWLSGEESLRYAHQLRAESDAILVGGGTLRCDNPSLTIRKPLRTMSESKQQPWRIVVTQDAQRLKQQAPQAALFQDEHRERTLIFEHITDWEEQVLKPLFAEHQVIQLMLECGGSLLQELLSAGLINEWVQIITPYLAGGPHDLMAGESYLPQEFRLCQQELRPMGADMVVRGLLEPS